MQLPKTRAKTSNGTTKPIAIFAPVERPTGSSDVGGDVGEVSFVEDCALVGRDSVELTAPGAAGVFDVDVLEEIAVFEESSCRISVSVACHRTCISSTHTVGEVTVATVIVVSEGFSGIGPSANVEVE